MIDRCFVNPGASVTQIDSRNLSHTHQPQPRPHGARHTGLAGHAVNAVVFAALYIRLVRTLQSISGGAIIGQLVVSGGRTLGAWGIGSAVALSAVVPPPVRPAPA